MMKNLHTMRLYNTHPFASIQMVADQAFLAAIPYHDVMLESGTYIGLGSTAMLAATRPKRLITIESDFSNYEQAVANLAQFPFVEPYWGLSVDRDMALEFIAGNDYSGDFYVDSENPVEFYTREVSVRCYKENLLTDLLLPLRDSNPLILLDSAGGIGFLEYSIVRQIMGNKPHTLILDDTHHVKHYRSRLDALQHYTVLYDDLNHGRCVLSL